MFKIQIGKYLLCEGLKVVRFTESTETEKKDDENRDRSTIFMMVRKLLQTELLDFSDCFN